MNNSQLRKLTGVLFVAGAILVNIPYTLLIINFDYPDILREPVDIILTRFQAGGTGLILTWLAFAWTGIPLLFAILLLHRVLEREDAPYLWAASTAGVIGGVSQMIGLLRWVFVVPILASVYTEPATGQAAREAATVAFQAVHQFGGVLLGEHIGQAFTILWMLGVSFTMFRSRLFKPWLAWFGIAASAAYALAQTELLATVIPAFPVMPAAGLVGSLLWLAWMLVMGVVLLRARAGTAN